MIVYPDNPRDRALFSALPIIMAPTQDPLPEIAIGATRLVLARDGIYIEARTRVLHARGQIAEAVGLPYGDLQSMLQRFGDGDIDALLDDAATFAAGSLPNEWAGLIARDPALTKFMLALPAVTAASPHRVSYSTSSIDPLDVLWDIHSHGTGRAFFSGQDNADDLANPSPCFFAAVLGRVGSARPEIKTRLIIGGRAFDEEALELGVHLGGA